MSYTIHYRPPEYGEIIPHDKCEHDPAGFRMDLGVALAGKGKRAHIHRDGWFCMKCGTGQHVDAENWIDLWWLARGELTGKCPQFDLRLTKLAEAAFAGEFREFINATVQLSSQRQADAIGWASR